MMTLTVSGATAVCSANNDKDNICDAAMTMIAVMLTVTVAGTVTIAGVVAANGVVVMAVILAVMTMARMVKIMASRIMTRTAVKCRVSMTTARDDKNITHHCIKL
jgi:hypothetical protein